MSEWVVSAFATVSWNRGRVELTSTTSGLSIVSEDLELVRLVHFFARPLSIDEATRRFDPTIRELVRNRVNDLIRAGVLTAADEHEAAAVHGWDEVTLAFHRHSRRPLVANQSHGDPHSASLPVPQSLIALKRGLDEGKSLERVVEARRSTREWARCPLAFDAFSRVLWLSVRVRTDLTGSISRPYPSGGAVYSLNVYIVMKADSVATVGPGVYKYHPAFHGLELVSSDIDDVEPFLDAARRSLGTGVGPPIVLLVTSRFREQGQRYGTVAYSLVLKEVGCLFQTLYLAAESVGVGACALGGGSPARKLARLNRTTELAEPIVGEFALGAR